MNQKELLDELTTSQIKYMICTLCEIEVGFSQDGDEDDMEEHFKEKHGFKGE